MGSRNYFNVVCVSKKIWVMGFFGLGIICAHCGSHKAKIAIGVIAVLAILPFGIMTYVMFKFGTKTRLFTGTEVGQKSIMREVLRKHQNVDPDDMNTYLTFVQHIEASQSGVYLWPMGVITTEFVTSVAGKLLTLFSIYSYLTKDVYVLEGA